MRVLIITGSYPPDRCGVGDYTYHLANALAEVPTINVHVLTSARKPRSFVSGTSEINVSAVISKWNLWNALQALRVTTSFRPNVIHLQFPTQGYNGILATLLPLLLRLFRVPIVQTWHEGYHNGGVTWANVLACDALLYVRPSMSDDFPNWVKKRLRNKPSLYVPNPATIPAVKLSADRTLSVRCAFSEDKPLVTFFGFAHLNKGMERLFTIADPARHHLVLICDLSRADPYQSQILDIAAAAPWAGNVTITGFLSPDRVAETLAVSDAVVFPFPGGAGEWNTSLRAAQNSGAFVLATSKESGLLGYNEKTNTYFSGCDQTADMKNSLAKYIGRRNPPFLSNEWASVATLHERLYRTVVVE